MKRAAFGIAETLLASAIIAMVIMGLYGISSATSRSAQTQENRVTAVAQAEEGIDLVRLTREQYWRGEIDNAPGLSADGFWTYLASKAGVAANSTTLTWNDMTTGWSNLLAVPGYSRSLSISKDAADMVGKLSYLDSTTGQPVALDATKADQAAASLLKVTVTVTWTTAGGPESYSMTSYLTDWMEGML